MAVLEKIRGKAILLVVAIGLGLFAFIFGDVGNWMASLSRDSEMDAFIVNGNKVKIQDYETEVNMAMEQYKQMNRNLSKAESQQVRNMVYQSMVSKQIMREEADKIGLSVTPAETFDLVQGNNLSPVILQSGLFNNPETGQFDRASLLNFLKVINGKANTPEEEASMEQYKSMWANLESNVRANRLQEKYSNLLAGATVTNKLEEAYYAKANGTVADVAYVQRTVAQATDLNIEVSDADVKAYYESHKEMYSTPSGGADVDIIYTLIQPSAKDFENAKEDIQAADEALRAGQNPALVLDDFSDIKYQDTYFALDEFNNPMFPADFTAFLSNASVGEVSGIYDLGRSISVAKLVDKRTSPEMLRVSHIVLAPEGAMEGQPKLDSLLTVIKAEPSRFSELASTYSLDRNSSSNGGEIGWLNEAIAAHYLGEEFSNAIYNAQIGVPFSFKSQYGEHIILVNEAKANVPKFKVAFALRNVIPSSETQGAIYNEMSSFLAENKGDDLDSLALNKGYQVIKNVKVNSMQPELAQGIENSRSLIRWAMTAKAGEVSDITECGDKYVFTRLNSSFEGGAYVPYDFVKEELKEVVRQEKTVDAMYQQLTENKYSTLDAFASAINTTVDTLSAVKYNTGRLASIGFEPALNAVAAFGKTGTIHPVKGIRSVYLTNVLNRTEDSGTLADTKLQLNAERKGLVRSQALAQVIQAAKIVDKRAKFQ